MNIKINRHVTVAQINKFIDSGATFKVIDKKVNLVSDDEHLIRIIKGLNNATY